VFDPTAQKAARLVARAQGDALRWDAFVARVRELRLGTLSDWILSIAQHHA
jgi:hypothetical protein